MLTRTGRTRPAPRLEPSVLLVDDDTAITDMYDLGLTRLGYEVSTAHDGRAGLQKALESQPDMVVMDVDMPAMDGIQALIRLRSHPSGARLPVIMLTNTEDEQLRRRARDLGALQWVIKSKTTPRRLADSIETWLGIDRRFRRQHPPAPGEVRKSRRPAEERVLGTLGL